MMKKIRKKRKVKKADKNNVLKLIDTTWLKN